MAQSSPYTSLKDRSLKVVRMMYGLRKLAKCKLTCMRCEKKFEKVLPVGTKTGLCDACRDYANHRAFTTYGLGTVE